MPKPVIVIDGSNVAGAEKTPDGRPKLHNILVLDAYFRERGFATEVFVDATLKSAIDRPDELEVLLRKQSFRQSPGREIEADQFILETALQTDGLVASNDRFKDFRKQFAVMFVPPTRFVRFLIVRGNVQLPNQSLALLRENPHSGASSRASLHQHSRALEVPVCGECGTTTPAGILKIGGGAVAATPIEFAEACARSYGTPLCARHLADRHLLPRCVDLTRFADWDLLSNQDLVWAIVERAVGGTLNVVSVGESVERAPLKMHIRLPDSGEGTVREWTPAVILSRSASTGEPATLSLTQAQDLLAWAYVRSAHASRALIEGRVIDTALKDGRPRGLTVDVVGCRAFLPRSRTAAGSHNLHDDAMRAVFDALHGQTIRVRIHDVDLSTSQIILTQTGWETGATAVPLIDVDETTMHTDFGCEVHDTREESGAVVVYLEATGTAARGGVQPGDVVQQVGPVHIRTAADFWWAMNQRPRDLPTPFQVRRNGSGVTRHVVLGAQQADVAPTRALAVVAANGGGDFATIGEALEVAPAGATVLVRPGCYEETIHVSRSVSLVADGSTDQVVILGREPICVDGDAHATIRGFSVRGPDQFGPMLRAGTGRLNLEDCIVESIAEPATFLGDISVRTSAVGQVQLSPGSHVRFEGCAVRAGRKFGLAIAEQSSARLCRSRVRGESTVGIYLWGGELTLEHSEVTSDRFPAILVQPGGRVTSLDSTLDGAWDHLDALGLAEASVDPGNDSLTCSYCGRRLGDFLVRRDQIWYVASQAEFEQTCTDLGLAVTCDGCQLQDQAQ